MNKNYIKFGLVLTGIALVFIIGINIVISLVNRDDSAVIDTVKQLKKQETLDIEELEQNIAEIHGLSDTMSDSLEISKELSALSLDELKKHYVGTVIVGDDFPNGIVEHGLMDRDIILSKNGLHISESSEELKSAVKLNPSNIILCFGWNELSKYGADTDSMINDYIARIDEFLAAQPNVNIFIHSVLPVQHEGVTLDDYSHVSDYNTRLKAFCEEKSYTFIDATALFESDLTAYDNTENRLTEDFYSKWLLFIAEKAGL